MTERELLLAHLTKAYNKTETELAPFLFEQNEKGEITGLKPDAADQLYKLDADRVTSWKTKSTDQLTKLAAEKTAAINAAWEQRLKEGFGITDDLKGDDLFNKTLEVYKSHAAGDGKGKSSKDYLELESRYKTLESKIGTEFVPKTDFDKFKSDVERQQRLSVAVNQAKQIKAGLKLVIPEDPIIRQTTEKYFDVALMERFDDVEITNDGKIYPLKNGVRIENNNGYAVDFTEIVRETSRQFYQEAKQPPTGGGGGARAGEPGSGGGTGRLAEIQNKLADPNLTNAEKFALMKEAETLKLQKA